MIGQAKSVVDTHGESYEINVECSITNGLPAVIIVGFANRAVDEAKERLRAAFRSSDITFPKKRVAINLAPADTQKDSTGFDMAMAVAVMRAGKLVHSTKDSTLYVGELGLDGSVRAVRGIIGKIIAGKKLGYTKFCIPAANVEQARLVPNVTLLPVRNLFGLYEHLNGVKQLQPLQTGAKPPIDTAQLSAASIDLIDVSGQQQAKRVLEIAAAGGHNILFNGPPGTGKSMLAKALLGILPDMSSDEILEVTHIHSLANTNYDKIITQRPFRSPHHSASHIAIIGGGTNVRPGEASLSHRGVLFLDELPEYNRSTIEALRQPLEDKSISISRAQRNASYPADFILIATSNPCPCGFYGTDKACVCPPHALVRYQQKLSGPILDRIDLYTEVEGVDHDQLLKERSGHESSDSVRQRTHAARKRQTQRYKSAMKTNANLSNKEIKQFAQLSPEAEATLNKAAAQLDMSARGYMRLVKVARTIADLEDSENIQEPHILEAVQYRKQPINA